MANFFEQKLANLREEMAAAKKSFLSVQQKLRSFCDGLTSKNDEKVDTRDTIDVPKSDCRRVDKFGTSIHYAGLKKKDLISERG